MSFSRVSIICLIWITWLFPLPSMAQRANAGAGSDSVDPGVKRNAEALHTFVLQYQDSDVWKEYRQADGKCTVDQKRHRVTLAFSADGRLACEIEAIPEDYMVLARVLAPKEFQKRYAISASQGEVTKSRIMIRGSWSSLKELADMANAAINPPLPEYAWVEADFGPFQGDKVAFQVRLEEADISWNTTLEVSHRYHANLALLIGIGPGSSTYSVRNGRINASADAPEPDYYLTCHVYPLSWHRFGGKTVYGRYFDAGARRVIDRFSLIGGFSASNPTKSAYLGIGIEVYTGIAISAGWQPRKEQQLQEGFGLDEAIAGSSAPVDNGWNFSNWGVGVAIDTVAAKRVLASFK